MQRNDKQFFSLFNSFVLSAPLLFLCYIQIYAESVCLSVVALTLITNALTEKSPTLSKRTNLHVLTISVVTDGRTRMEKNDYFRATQIVINMNGRKCTHISIHSHDD